jgi:phosphoribosylanthranilate isomerase|nr:phosphoribosylanthranilate isomerase [Candidatus Krumholzibacteria bacterium]
MATRIKICCITSPEEAQLAIRLGADALGLVSAMPSGPGVISEALIGEIAQAVPPPVGTFLLTSKTTAGEIVLQQKRCRTGTIQIVDRVPPAVHMELRQVLPGVSLVQVIHVRGDEAVDEALDCALGVDALLLDSGQPDSPTRQLGGTGRTHDWSLSAEIVRRSPVPVFLAGGLTPDNVAQAIARVRPFGVDVCSGVRQENKLSEPKLAQFMSEVQKAG